MAERCLQLAQLAPAMALAAALTGGCAALPQPGTPVEEPGEYPVSGPEHRQAVMKPATESLLEQSRGQRRSGENALAAATLERAIRIDPGEPAVWLELAHLRYDEDNWSQAEQLARKARSLAGENTQVGAEARELLADALSKQGRTMEAERVRESG